MDSQRFQKATLPTFKPVINKNVLEMAVKNVETPLKSTDPVPDMRYPEYASIMYDGRLATDYKSHCANNTASSEYGNSIRAWFQHNADGVIQVSRKRQAERAGAYFYKAATVPEARQLQQCDQFECKFQRNKNSTSIGLERVEGVPSLFGTFGEPINSKPVSREYLTTNFEGGRNTPRGRQYVPLEKKMVFPNSAYNHN